MILDVDDDPGISGLGSMKGPVRVITGDKGDICIEF